MIKMINEKLRKLLNYTEKISGYTGCLCIFNAVLDRKFLRPITISDYQIYVRTNTPDLDVAISSLCYKEYNHINLSDPKTIYDLGQTLREVNQVTSLRTTFKNSLLCGV